MAESKGKMPGWMKWLILFFILYAVANSAMRGPTPMQKHLRSAENNAQNAPAGEGVEAVAHQPDGASDGGSTESEPPRTSRLIPSPVTQEVPMIRVADKKLGQGAGPAVCGQKVAIYYDGFLKDRTRFDTNQNASKPLEFTLGQGEVVRGLEQGIIGMRVGTVRTITVPPALGFDDPRFTNDAVPPGSTVTYELHLSRLEPGLPTQEDFGVRIFPEQEGRGAPAGCGDAVRLQLRLHDGAGKPLTEAPQDMRVTLGKDALPAGLLMAVEGMRVGAVRTALISPAWQVQLGQAGEAEAAPLLPMLPVESIAIFSIMRLE